MKIAFFGESNQERFFILRIGVRMKQAAKECLHNWLN